MTYIEEIALAQSKNSAENKLAFVVMLKFFQMEGRYPTNDDIIAKSMINSLAVQLNCYDICLENYDWNSRTSERFRQEIRLLLGYRKVSSIDSKRLINWLMEYILPEAPTLSQLHEQAYQFFRKHNLEPFKPKQLDRYISTACYRFEQQFFADIFKQLSTAQCFYYHRSPFTWYCTYSWHNLRINIIFILNLLVLFNKLNRLYYFLIIRIISVKNKYL